MKPEKPDPLISIRVLAERLGVGRRTAYRIAVHEMRHCYVRSCLRVPESEIGRWNGRNMHPPEDECLASTDAAAPGTATGETPTASGETYRAALAKMPACAPGLTVLDGGKLQGKRATVK